MSEDREELHDARRAAANAAVLTVITIAFGFVWLVDPADIPNWVASIWFVLVIPINLFLLYSTRKRYRMLRDAADDSGTP